MGQYEKDMIHGYGYARATIASAKSNCVGFMAAINNTIGLINSEIDEVKTHPSGCFAFNVPVYVEIDKGKVASVRVDDGVPIREGNPRLCEPDSDEHVDELICAAEEDQEWPSWGWA